MKHTKNTEGIISAKTVCTISSSYLCTFIAFSPCGETLRLLGMLLIPPRRFLSLLNVTGALGAQITLESCIFFCRFASGLKLRRMKGREGRENIISMPGEMISLIFSGSQ